MEFIDWLIVSLYIFGIIGMSILVGRRQKNQEDYYLGGRTLPSWQVGLSMVANQVSAISLIGAPAFIALKENGGLIWLQYEMAIPLAMIAIIIFILPRIRSKSAVTIYAYLGERFGMATRQVVSFIFLISRSMATGVALLATAYVTAACTGWPLIQTIIVIGIVSLIYTMMGGIRADIYSDILQLGILWIASIAVIITILVLSSETSSLIPRGTERFTVFQLGKTGIGDGATFSFWPMLMGGFFLYVSYYGCDQSQAQRLLGAGSDKGAVKALLINGLVRYPLVVTYCVIGILMISFLKSEHEFRALLSGLPPDYLMPQFFVRYLPPGILGLTIAGIFAASMSSIDSAINSLSAATWNDFILPFRPEFAEIEGRRQVLWSRIITILWGSFTLFFAIGMAGGNETVIELVNKIGSAFYGPIAAVFLLGTSKKNIKQGSILLGLTGGFLFNIYLWLVHGNTVSWMWWNLTGLMGTLLLGVIAHMVLYKKSGASGHNSIPTFDKGGRAVVILIAWFVFIILSAAFLEKLLT